MNTEQIPLAPRCPNPECGAPVNPGKKFCRACGRPVPLGYSPQQEPVAKPSVIETRPQPLDTGGVPAAEHDIHPLPKSTALPPPLAPISPPVTPLAATAEYETAASRATVQRSEHEFTTVSRADVSSESPMRERELRTGFGTTDHASNTQPASHISLQPNESSASPSVNASHSVTRGPQSPGQAYDDAASPAARKVTSSPISPPAVYSGGATTPIGGSRAYAYLCVNGALYFSDASYAAFPADPATGRPVGPMVGRVYMDSNGTYTIVDCLGQSFPGTRVG